MDPSKSIFSFRDRGDVDGDTESLNSRSEAFCNSYSKYPMKLKASIISQPCSVFMFLVVVLLFQALVIGIWQLRLAKQLQQAVDEASNDVDEVLFSIIKESTRSLLPINLSAFNLARVLNSSANVNLSSFSMIENQVAHDLFMAFSIIPSVSQISYIGEDGLLFSYYKESNRTFALFANTSNPSTGTTLNDSLTYRWYTQEVDNYTGMRFGEVIESAPVIFTNSSWFYNALNSKNGYNSWGLGWGKSKEPLFISMVALKCYLPEGRRGVISIGIPVKAFTQFVSSIDLHEADLYIVTKDGHLLKRFASPYINIEINKGNVSVGEIKSNNRLGEEEYVNLSCKLTSYSGVADSPFIASKVNIQGMGYTFYCASFEIVGIQMVSVLGFRHKGLVLFVHKLRTTIFVLLLLMPLSTILLSIIFGLFIVSGMKKEISFRAAHIKNMEAIQQAERKSMNKSLAFARASHDIRTSLVSISGLIEICRGQVPRNSQLEKDLVDMNKCASNLLGILNFVLDTSKMEAGKMQLEENEFDMAQVLEEVVDMFFVVGWKKGLEVMLDPCEGSFLKPFHVKGDCLRLKQILCNLLSNAVKYTSEGHVVMRAWVRKPSSETSILASNTNGFGHYMSQIFCKNDDTYKDFGPLHADRSKTDCLEFLFEVDDTGNGIPKEKQKSVFENFVQVKESYSGNIGTGLGLGIVQSLVRLMGGEINIVDKGPGEKGTCFKFNIFLKTSDPTFSLLVEGGNMKICGDQIPNELRQPNLSEISDHNSEFNTQILLSSRSTRPNKAPKYNAILCYQGEEGRKIIKKWMEGLRIKVWSIDRWEHLQLTLERMKKKFFLNNLNNCGIYESTSISSYSNNSESFNTFEGEMEGFASANMRTREHYKRTRSRRTSSTYLLIIIDASCGPFLEIFHVLENFGNNVHSSRFKVVWLTSPNTSNDTLSSLMNKRVPCDLIVNKPFHGSRLRKILKLLQRFGETNESYQSERSAEVTMLSPESGPSNLNIMQARDVSQHISGAERNMIGDYKPLRGMHILVAEDHDILRKLAVAKLSSLGATIDSTENGEVAYNKVYQALQIFRANNTNEGIEGTSKSFPYDLILMDCEMPIMNGYEATKKIRKEELRFGIRVPIIALTAHEGAEERNKSTQAGMDFHMMKPLEPKQLLDVIQSINGH